MQHLIFAMEPEPVPSLKRRLSKKLSRKPFTLRFLDGIFTTPGETEEFQKHIDISKRLYKESPVVCIDVIMKVACEKLHPLDQRCLIRNLLMYENGHARRQFVVDHLSFVFGLDVISEYYQNK